MAAVLSNRFHVFADITIPEGIAKKNTRYDPVKKPSQRKTDAQYRNYIDLETDYRAHSVRRGVVLALIKRLSDPAQVSKETNTRVLIYELRLQALVWAFFGGREFTEIASRDLITHAGYDELHTSQEAAIISGFSTSIIKFQQGKTADARKDFNAADKAFGELRHAEWVASQ